jgi:hypothetical protein
MPRLSCSTCQRANALFARGINLSNQHDNVLNPDVDPDDNFVELSFAPCSAA